MGEEVLVEGQVADVAALAKALKAKGFQPTMLVWHYDADANDWRLLLAGPSLDTLLPMEQAQAYLKVSEALDDAKVASLTISDIKVVRTDNPLLKVVRTLLVTTADAVVQTRFRNNWMNGIFIKDMLVLRSAK